MSGQVAGPHGAVVGQRMRLEFGGQFPTVERLAVGRGDRLERGGVIGQPEQLAGLRRPPAGQKRLGESGLRSRTAAPAPPTAPRPSARPESRCGRKRLPVRRAARRAACRTSRAVRPTPTPRRARSPNSSRAAEHPCRRSTPASTPRASGPRRSVRAVACRPTRWRRRPSRCRWTPAPPPSG